VSEWMVIVRMKKSPMISCKLILLVLVGCTNKFEEIQQGCATTGSKGAPLWEARGAQACVWSFHGEGRSLEKKGRSNGEGALVC
jgi:hypothetical protein